MNPQYLMQMVGQFRRNPQMLLQKYGIPQNLKTPDDVADYLLQNGKVTKEQIEHAKAMCNR